MIWSYKMPQGSSSSSNHSLTVSFLMLQKKNDRKKPSFPVSKPMAGSSIMSTAFFKTPSFSSIKTVLVILFVLAIVYLLFILALPTPLPLISPGSLSPTTSRHLVISIASSSKSWSQRKPFVRLWYKPDSTRAFAFLDRELPEFDYVDPSVPPILVSSGTSEFPYTFDGGLRSAIRVARVVKEIVERGESDVRWFVFGDDDTVFFMDNLAKTLARYDHENWYYIGGNSESYEQNQKYSFDMAFGGGGFAISSSLARVLARVLDSCLMRYPHLYGSDSRIFSCLAELGVSLTREPGFHQVDMRGNLFGMLSAHPLSPIVSLHHLDAMDPIFPNLTTIQALEHLFEAVDVDSAGVFQQTVCYDRSNSLTISVSWGFSIQVFEGNQLLPDLLSLQRSFNPWRRSSSASHFMFNTRDYQKDPCKRPLLFYMEDVAFIKNNVWSNYSRHMVGNCRIQDSMKGVQQIRVVTQKFEFDPKQALRRRCCDVIPSSDEQESMLLHIRQCLGDELISMQK